LFVFLVVCPSPFCSFILLFFSFSFSFSFHSAPLGDVVAEKDEFKTIATLRVEIMEGREIGKSKATTNPYCVILLDDEEKTTTTTKHKTTTPFWGQDYVFESGPFFFLEI